jgi:Protein of unknown function (DUF3467)
MGQEPKGFVEAGQLEGRYANYFEVGHNALEFLFDFGQLFPESTEARFHTRIITSPVYALAFLRTVQKSIVQYERSFGVIFTDDEPEA